MVQDGFEDVARAQILSDPGLQLGSLLFAFGLDALLMGCALTGFLRWAGSPRTSEDKGLVKAMVCLAFATAVAETCLTWYKTINNFGVRYGTFAQFFDFEYMFYFAALDVVTVSAVKVFFADRAYRISGRSKLVVFAITFFQCASFAAAVGITVLARGHTMLDTVPGLIACLYLWPAGCLVADLVMAGTITYNLGRNRSGPPRVARIMKRLLIVSIEGQLGGIIVAITFIACFAAMPHGFAPVFFLFWFPKVYLLGALTVLNSRDWWQREKTTTVDQQSTEPQASNPVSTESGIELKTPTASHSDFVLTPYRAEIFRKTSSGTFGGAESVISQ